MTALHLFFSNFPFTGREETLRALLAAGNDPLAVDRFGKTAMDYASINAPEMLPTLKKTRISHAEILFFSKGSVVLALGNFPNLAAGKRNVRESVQSVGTAMQSSFELLHN